MLKGRGMGWGNCPLALSKNIYMLRVVPFKEKKKKENKKIDRNQVLPQFRVCMG